MTVRARRLRRVIALAAVAAACGRGERGDAADTFRARFETSEGDFVIEVHRDWAPLGADRFHELVSSGYYDGARFFRVLPGFVAQFGIHGDPQVAAAWRERRIADDPVRESNARGTVTFATGGPDTRTTQVFINYADNGRLDAMGFAPFGRVVEGMDVVDRLHAGYGEGAPRGPGPDQSRIQAEGNAYLEREFPELDYVRRAAIEAP
ncbi:MAG: peptidylprolyl isomerase [Gemmatimonadales bacterium]